MSQIKYPLCYHPTTIIVVNGDRFNLNKICSAINHNYFVIKPFTDAQAALNYVNTMRLSAFNRRCTHALEEDLKNRNVMGVNLNNIKNEIFETNRFSQVSTVMIDYSMSGQDAFEFCEQINNDNIHKVLLSEQKDAQLITEAFNRNLINKYVHLKSNNLKNDMNNALLESQLKYFMRHTDILYNTAIARLSPEKKTIFIDPKFHELFTTLVDGYNINEYYLTSVNGSYLMHTLKNETYQLDIHDSANKDSKKFVGEYETYYYTFKTINEKEYLKQPTYLEQFYLKHPKESVY